MWRMCGRWNEVLSLEAVWSRLCSTVEKKGEERKHGVYMMWMRCGGGVLGVWRQEWSDLIFESGGSVEQGM